MKNVLILASSPRKGGNTDLLCDEFAKGAKEAGNKVTKIRIADKKIGYCTGCYACQKTHKCVIKDDAATILKKMQEYPPGRRPAAKRAATRGADVIVFGTPAYFYSCTGQLKVLFDRTVAIYPDLPNKQYYYLLAQGDESKDTFAGTIKSLDGFLDCYDGSKLKGMVAAPGIYEKGAIKGTKYLAQAYKLGLKVK